MDIKKILLISLIAVAIVVSVSSVSAGLFDGLIGEQQKDNVIEIDHISFNTTNVTKFKLENESTVEGAYCRYYLDENESGYNVWIYNDSGLDYSALDNDINYFKNNYYNNVPSQTVDGIVVYTTSAVKGNHVGEPRYEAYIQNQDLKSIVRFSTPDANETAKMASTLKFK